MSPASRSASSMLCVVSTMARPGRARRMTSQVNLARRGVQHAGSLSRPSVHALLMQSA